MKIRLNLQLAEYIINRFCKCGLFALYRNMWMVSGGVYASKNGLCDLTWQVNIFNLLNLNFSLCRKCSQDISQLIPFLIISVNVNCQIPYFILYYLDIHLCTHTPRPTRSTGLEAGLPS